MHSSNVAQGNDVDCFFNPELGLEPISCICMAAEDSRELLLSRDSVHPTRAITFPVHLRSQMHRLTAHRATPLPDNKSEVLQQALTCRPVWIAG